MELNFNTKLLFILLLIPSARLQFPMPMPAMPMPMPLPMPAMPMIQVPFLQPNPSAIMVSEINFHDVDMDDSAERREEEQKKKDDDKKDIENIVKKQLDDREKIRKEKDRVEKERKKREGQKIELQMSPVAMLMQPSMMAMPQGPPPPVPVGFGMPPPIPGMPPPMPFMPPMMGPMAPAMPPPMPMMPPIRVVRLRHNRPQIPYNPNQPSYKRDVPRLDGVTQLAPMSDNDDDGPHCRSGQCYNNRRKYYINPRMQFRQS